MLCAISGEQPEVPVASRKSGNVFEKRLIETYISENGTDPVSGEPLAADDLIELQTTRTVRPRPPTLTSIPALLSTFQNEWDAIALETYTLKQQLVQTRQELSTALYEYDGALRVIARVQKERDEARAALSRVTLSGEAGAQDAMDVDTQSLPTELADLVGSTQTRLSSTRRKRPVPDDWATEQSLQGLEKVYQAEGQGVQAQIIATNSEATIAFVGAADGTMFTFDLDQNKVISSSNTEAGAITTAVWYKDSVAIGTSTGNVILVEDSKNLAKSHQLASHAGEVTSISLHPSNALIASTGRDRHYKFFDLTAEKQVVQVSTPSSILCGEFHPDGHLFAVGGEDGQIRLYDVTGGAQVADFDAGAAVHAIAFSENGTWLASAAGSQTSTSVWDLRKSAVIKTLDIGVAVKAIRWDWTGQFLAIAGAGCVAVEHYTKSTKKWSEPFKRAMSTSVVAWGANAQSLLVVADGGAFEVFAASQ